MFYVVLIFFLLFSQLDARAANPSYSKTIECAAARAEFEARFTRLQNKYLSLNQISVSDENKPTWDWGRKKQAVYLLHGFIGTPEEMSALGKKLKLQK